MASATSSGWERVEEVVEAAGRAGTVGVSIIGPHGATWQHHGDRVFNAASTFKIAVMVAVYRAVDAGSLDLDARYSLTEDDRTGGSGVLNHLEMGASVTYRDLVYLMISISDNLATDVLLITVGIENVNATMRDLGMKHSRVETTIRDMFAAMRERIWGGGPIIPATANDYATAIAAILGGSAASEASCAAMREMLGGQQNRRRLARYLSQSGMLAYGSKTGTMTGVCNDVGFVTGPNGQLIIAVYTENFPDSHVAEGVIGEIARAAMVDTGVAGPTFTS